VLEGYFILPLYDQQNHYLVRPEVQGVRALQPVQAPTFLDAWLAG
jgi:peptide/nickel transport system substrate-binding protein